MTLDQMREELSAMLKSARAGEDAEDLVAAALFSGRATGIEDALKLINMVLQTETSARIKAAAQGTPLPRTN